MFSLSRKRSQKSQSLTNRGRKLRGELLETRSLLAAGDLDALFDADGKVTTDFLNASSWDFRQ